MIFKQQAEDDFDVKSVVSPEMEVVLRRCANIYAGAPPWLSADNDIRTINFAKAVSSETARLATLAIGIQIDRSTLYTSICVSGWSSAALTAPFS